MLFNSLTFLWFFLVVYALYLILDHRWQNRMLLVASYVFYGTWDYRFLSLLFISTLLDYACGIRIHEAGASPARRGWLLLSMIANLGMLGAFKYYNFFADSLQHLMGAFGMSLDLVTLKVILPVGISFYTFQTMSYTLDIYRRQLSPTRNFLDFALFVSFFPQLVAGPIERARNLLPQIENPRALRLPQIREGIFLIAWGLFQKVILADHAARIVNPAFASSATITGWEAILSCYAFFLQIYGDFSGYSDMARGLAKTMGFELMVNFRTPFCAVRPSDFWSRWHISLTTWVRDYLFVSIGGTKRGALRTRLNLIVVMTVIGLWHGANWTFVIWGFLFGLLQAGHSWIHPFLARAIRLKTRAARTAWNGASMFVNIALFAATAPLFRGRDLHQTREMFGALQRGFPVTPDVIRTAGFLLFLAIPLAIMQTLQYRTDDQLAFMKQPPTARFLGYLLAAAMMGFLYLFASGIHGGEEFIYFQF